MRYMFAICPLVDRTITEQIADNNKGYFGETYEMFWRKIGGKWEEDWRSIEDKHD